jgi:hypothetical protein
MFLCVRRAGREEEREAGGKKETIAALADCVSATFV